MYYVSISSSKATWFTNNYTSTYEHDEARGFLFIYGYNISNLAYLHHLATSTNVVMILTDLFHGELRNYH